MFAAAACRAECLRPCPPKLGAGHRCGSQCLARCRQKLGFRKIGELLDHSPDIGIARWRRPVVHGRRISFEPVRDAPRQCEHPPHHSQLVFSFPGLVDLLNYLFDGSLGRRVLPSLAAGQGGFVGETFERSKGGGVLLLERDELFRLAVQ
jgi:hypothetical protein